ncbi:MAG: CinA family protein [Lachnospiraceae bacterium]|nr:CinA family protein [Lachnospiraceae bacterium]
MENEMIELNEISQKLVDKLIENKLTISTAESCTGGMISSAIVNVPGASSVLNEAIVTYSNAAKMKYLGVKEDTLNKYGAVSEEVAWQMVEGIAKEANADCAIAVTGIAGPDGGTKDKPVGTVYAGLYYKGDIKVTRYNFKGDRYLIRLYTTINVLEDMYKTILDL